MLLYARWAANLMKQDASLYDIYAAEELTSLNPGKICWQVHQLKEVWQNQRPKLKRLSCDSFVLRSKNSSSPNGFFSTFPGLCLERGVCSAQCVYTQSHAYIMKIPMKYHMGPTTKCSLL